MKYLGATYFRPPCTAWPEKFHFVIYPLLNPDGYEYTWTDERLWRKNRNSNNGSSCKGVDLNRNYDIEWMNAGSSSNKCSSVYAGTEAFSEPESQAQRDDMLAMENKLAYLTYHAYSEFIIYPYSSSYSLDAHNEGELDMVASQMVANIEVMFFVFRVDPISQIFYFAIFFPFQIVTYYNPS